MTDGIEELVAMFRRELVEAHGVLASRDSAGLVVSGVGMPNVKAVAIIFVGDGAQRIGKQILATMGVACALSGGEAFVPTDDPGGTNASRN